MILALMAHDVRRYNCGQINRRYSTANVTNGLIEPVEWQLETQIDSQWKLRTTSLTPSEGDSDLPNQLQAWLCWKPRYSECLTDSINLTLLRLLPAIKAEGLWLLHTRYAFSPGCREFPAISEQSDERNRPPFRLCSSADDHLRVRDKIWHVRVAPFKTEHPFVWIRGHGTTGLVTCMQAPGMNAGIILEYSVLLSDLLEVMTLQKQHMLK